MYNSWLRDMKVCRKRSVQLNTFSSIVNIYFYTEINLTRVQLAFLKIPLNAKYLLFWLSV